MKVKTWTLYRQILETILVSVFTLLLIGCGSPDSPDSSDSSKKEKQQPKVTIDGSVFIATQGGETFKLALIPIGVATLEEYEAACASVLIKLEVTIAENKRWLIRNSSEYLELKKSYDVAYTAFESAKADEIQFKKRYDYRPRQAYPLIENEILPRSSLSATLSEAKRIVTEINLRVSESNKLAEKVNKFSEEIKKLGSNETITAILQKERKSFESRLRDVITQLHANAVHQTRSDADGKFSLELDSGKDYVLTGYGERKVGKKIEIYNWIVLLNVGGNEKPVSVFFSNTELAKNIPDEFRIKLNSENLYIKKHPPMTAKSEPVGMSQKYFKTLKR